MQPVNCAFFCSAYIGTRADDLLRCLETCFDEASEEYLVTVLLHIDGAISPNLEKYLTELPSRYGPRLVIERTKDNRGLAHGLNKLIDKYHKDFDYMFRIDTDDTNIPGRVANQIRYLQAHVDVDVLGGALIEQVQDDSKSVTCRVVRYPSKDAVRRTIVFRSPLAHPTVCFRSTVFSNGHLRYPNEGLNEDLAFWFLLLQQGYVIDNVDIPLVNFQIDRDFYDRRALSKAKSEFFVYVRGIRSLGLPWVFQIFPVLRLVLRLAPLSLIRWAYGSQLRSAIR